MFMSEFCDHRTHFTLMFETRQTSQLDESTGTCGTRDDACRILDMSGSRHILHAV